METSTAPAQPPSRFVQLLVRALDIEDRAGATTRETPLFGELPELDSSAWQSWPRP